MNNNKEKSPVASSPITSASPATSNPESRITNHESRITIHDSRIRSNHDSRIRSNHDSRITLVGAGPGDPDLITRKGLRALQTADAVLYDALSSDELLDETPAHCRRIFVGKRAGCHYKQQERINELIVECAFEYGHVVRLKGGDPFVFGRGQEEIAYARAHGIPTVTVPGISSCISLPELQGVAPTSRGYADSFWVLTAHTRDHGISPDLLLAPRSNATVIILMGLGRLDRICALWDAEGKGDLPAMVIQNGSRPDEKCWVGTVNDIAVTVTRERDKGPGIIVLGETVSQHPEFLNRIHATTRTHGSRGVHTFNPG